MNIIYSETGSAGNFSFLTDGKTDLVIDCGIPYAKANKAASYNLLNASAILITHSHS